MVMGVETKCVGCGLDMVSCVLPAMCYMCEALERERMERQSVIKEQSPPKPATGDRESATTES